MTDYKQDTVVGTKWQRCNRVQIINDYNKTPYIIFGEEQIINLGETYISTQPPQAQCMAPFNSAESIPLRDPSTGELTGSMTTHSELYQILYSLYIDTATKRDSDIEVAALGT